jgi:hypothetical protein
MAVSLNFAVRASEENSLFNKRISLDQFIYYKPQNWRAQYNTYKDHKIDKEKFEPSKAPK